MNIRVKTAGILIGTLFLGGILGVLGSRLWVQARVQRFQEHRGQRFFVQLHTQIIQPTPAQEDTVNAILEKYERKMLQLRRQFGDETRTMLDSLQAELKPILNEEQLERLQKRRGQPPHPQHFRPGSPPVHGEGPPPGGFRKNRPPRPPLD